MAKSIMIQGTMSNAGKSMLVAGLCRIFKQDGYKAAPFKSQNMALNSYITEDNLEMGRAQVVQAEAAGIAPSVLMNPILLKPTSDMGSQVILKGKAVGNMSAGDYFKKKTEYIHVIEEAYHELSKDMDIIVIEGAGSPAEINLKKNDIVNMGLAQLVDAPVLLVGDIDRGGVFAQLVGTVMLLEPDEQERIKGLVINKFRGDISILQPGLKMLEEKCYKKVLGVLPYADVHLEDEDSLAEGLLYTESVKGLIDIAVIRFPHISNFTDFQALSMEPMVGLRYVNNASQLGNPDVIILPGTKNTIGDMKWLRESGLEGRILRLLYKNEENAPVLMGICGGFQMLGQDIQDTNGIEHFGVIKGMGLFPMSTIFETEKSCIQAKGRTCHMRGILEPLSNKTVSGYEIHMGKTEGKLTAFMNVTDSGGVERADGCYKDNVFGTYLHGIFDEDEFRKAFLKLLCDRNHMVMDEKQPFSYREYKEQQYDKWAEIVRANLDMKAIYQIMDM